MKVLDCENIESIYWSFKSIFNLKVHEINSFLTELNLDEYYKSHPEAQNIYFLDFILDLFKKIFNREIIIDETRWFHISRTNNIENYKNSILPLNQTIEQIWTFLFGLIKKEFLITRWNYFREVLENNLEGRPAELYRDKIHDKNSWGPFAILNKEIAYKLKEISYHDYFKVPEIVEDICRAFHSFCGVNLLDKYLRNTKPCIVKFKMAGGEAFYIRHILYYLYVLIHKKDVSMYCNTDYDACGNSIPSDSILKVEYA